MNREILCKPFPADQIRQRPGQQGKTLNYIDIASVIARLNEGCDAWNFEIVRHEILEEEVIVLGKLTAVLFDEGEDLDTLAALGARMIEVFVVKVPLPDEVRAVELPFSVDIVDPDTGEVLPVPLIGAVDALVVENGRFYVWELKSGKRRWAPDALTYDLQPTAYRLGMKAHDVEIVHAMLVLTTKSKKPDVQIEELVRNENDERDLVATAASVIRGVEAGVDHPMRGWQCRSCPYAGACR